MAEAVAEAYLAEAGAGTGAQNLLTWHTDPAPLQSGLTLPHIAPQEGLPVLT